MTDAFQPYALDTPRAARTLYAKLKTQRDQMSSQVADGYAKDWPDYCRRIGVIEGLQLAMDLSDATAKEDNQ